MIASTYIGKDGKFMPKENRFDLKKSYPATLRVILKMDLPRDHYQNNCVIKVYVWKKILMIFTNFPSKFTLFLNNVTEWRAGVPERQLGKIEQFSSIKPLTCKLFWFS